MKKRMVALLLAGLMVSLTVTGCGANLTSATSDVETASSASTESHSSARKTSDHKKKSDSKKNQTKETAPREVEATDSEPTACDTVCVDVAEEEIGDYGLAYYDPYSDSYYDPYYNGENYATYVENAFNAVKDSPLSTFAADVDTASYANFRRMITDGYDLYSIPSGSIRTEEMINYFSYDYDGPKKGEPFGVNATICDCPWNDETYLLTLGIQAEEMKSNKRPASNIVFLIDVSGSMSGYDRIDLLKEGFSMLVDDLDENDRVSIVTYASDSSIYLEGETGDNHSKIKRAIKKLEANGSTNGGAGIISAYELAEKYFIEGGNNRVIMATDGDLNVGITDEDELEELITEEKESGVFLSVLGFGTGNYNDAALERLADKGNGNYSYIDGLSEAKKVLVDEFGSTIYTIAKDVKFQIEFNPAYVSEYRQVGYENRAMADKDFNDDTKDGGEVGAGHSVTVMYEIKLSDDVEDDGITYRYQQNELTDIAVDTDEWMTVSIRYKKPNEDESKLLTYPISEECYTKKPSCDTLFAASVAELSMIANDSEYIGNIDIDDVISQVEDLDLDGDEYKAEFLDLLYML